MLQCGMCGFGYIDLALTDERTDWSDKHTKKVEKKTKTAKNEHRNASNSVLFRHIQASKACLERKRIVPSGANPRV